MKTMGNLAQFQRCFQAETHLMNPLPYPLASSRSQCLMRCEQAPSDWRTQVFSCTRHSSLVFLILQ